MVEFTVAAASRRCARKARRTLPFIFCYSFILLILFILSNPSSLTALIRRVVGHCPTHHAGVKT
jgi:hypothetical protein